MSATTSSDQLDGELRRAFAWLSSMGNFMVIARDGEIHVYRGGVRKASQWDMRAVDGAAVSFLSATAQAKEAHDRGP